MRETFHRELLIWADRANCILLTLCQKSTSQWMGSAMWSSSHKNKMWTLSAPGASATPGMFVHMKLKWVEEGCGIVWQRSENAKVYLHFIYIYSLKLLPPQIYIYIYLQMWRQTKTIWNMHQQLRHHLHLVHRLAACLLCDFPCSVRIKYIQPHPERSTPPFSLQLPI